MRARSMLKLDNVNLDLTRASAQRYMAWVRTACRNYPKLSGHYGFSMFDAALVAHLEPDHPDAAFVAAIGQTMATEKVASEMELIDTGKSPVIDNDSYLGVGATVRGIAAVATWCGPLPGHTEDLWAGYCARAVDNVWNPKTAQWGGKPAPWSGWSIDDPENNYFFSFLEATVWHALVFGGDSDMALAREKMQLSEKFWSGFGGGGSAEGTGYGRAQARLFRTASVWMASTGEELPGIRAHAEDTVLYIIHATTPDFAHMVAVGDQSAESQHKMAASDRSLMLQACSIVSGPALNCATWWLSNVSENNGAEGRNEIVAVHRRRWGPPAPPGLTYFYASGAGHYFWRNSWGADATTFAVFSCGPNHQVHDSHDQGGIYLWFDGQWILTSQNFNSHSGILQLPQYQNTLVFAANGKVLPQARKGAGAFVEQENSNEVIMDLKGAYAAGTFKWGRAVEIGQDEIVIADSFSIDDPDVTVMLQFNSPIEPIDRTGTVHLGQLTLATAITVDGSDELLMRVNPQITAWKEVDPKEHKGGGYRITFDTGRRSGTFATTIQFPRAAEPPVVEEPEPPAEDCKALRAEVDALHAEIDALHAEIDALHEDLVGRDVAMAESQAEIARLLAVLESASALRVESLMAVLTGEAEPGASVAAIDHERGTVVLRGKP